MDHIVKDTKALELGKGKLSCQQHHTEEYFVIGKHYPVDS